MATMRKVHLSGGSNYGKGARCIKKFIQPKGAPEADSKKIRTLKKRLHDLYARYKATAGSKTAWTPAFAGSPTARSFFR